MPRCFALSIGLALCLAFLTSAVFAQSGRRLALVIGNSAYPAGRMRNAADDSRQIAEALEQAGFHVTAQTDLNLRGFRSALDSFARGVQPGDVALLYFSGYAIQASGQNYLAPVDFPMIGGSAPATYGVSATQALGQLQQRGASLAWLVLDACRAAPWSGGRPGLAPIEAGRGAAVVFSCAAGSNLADRAGPGLFASALTRVLSMQPASVLQLLEDLRREVATTSEGRQVPYVSRDEASSARTVLASPVFMQAQAQIPPATAEQPPAYTAPPSSVPMTAVPTLPQPPDPRPTGQRSPPYIPAGGSAPVALPAGGGSPYAVAGGGSPNAAAGGGSPAAPSFERFPTINAPDRIADGVEFAVEVALRMELETPDVIVAETGDDTDKTPNGGLRFHLPCDPRCNIDVVLAAPGFEFASGSNQATVSMKRDEGSSPARFVLRSKAGFTGDARVSATFWHAGNFLARAWRPLIVVTVAPGAPAGAPPRPGAAAPTYAPAPGGLPIAPRPPSNSLYVPMPNTAGIRPGSQSGAPVPLAITDTAPDLTVRWEENGGQHPYCSATVTSPFLVSMKSEECRTAAEMRRLIGSRLARIVGDANFRGVTAAQPGPATSLDELRGFGIELGRLLPASFEDAFWTLIDRQRSEPGFQFRTIQIYTNNPSFPWELVVPVRDGKPFDGFLGSSFQIARWHIDDRVHDLGPLSLHLTSVKAIAPRYTGAAALPYLRQEMAAIQNMPGYASVPGTMAELRALLQSPPEGIVHFAGHGDAVAASDGSMNYDIRMEDGSFDPTRLRALAGLTANHPVYFMNACQTGQETVEAGLIDGWAGAVLESGASGFIGGLWPLPDRGAAAFSAVFYKELLDDLAAGKAVSISELLMHTRQELLRTGDPTALAYVFYGDTRFRLLSAR